MFDSSPVDAVLQQEIFATELLHTRQARVPDYAQESEAMGRLAEVFANTPEALADTLAQTALQLTQAHAAGLSLEETEASPPVFRWVATAGTYARYQNQTLPRTFSPCGDVLRLNAPLLMREPVRVYPYISELHEPAHEVLLVPFHHDGRPVGTVWVVSHHDHLQFDAEDLRIVQTLTRFAAAALHSVGLVRKLSKAHAQQHEADLRKDRFMAVLAHEMRSPLSAISLGAQVIKRIGDDAPRRRAAVASIERQAAQLARLVSDITDVVAIRSGKMSLNLAPITAQEIVARALEACGEQLEHKRQQLDVQLPEHPLMVHGDLARLTQVVINLINNAIKYTPAQGRISVHACSTPHGVELIVSDTGVGLAPDTLPDVFDMFMQVPMTDRPLSSGLGIGLALVKQFVELHGGTVLAHSRGLGLGSSFTVSLPRFSPASA